ncbi:hypothetical protein [Psychroserpens sp.]|uniref:hypothetical protein n=1 Tax=Psychroserpens sp. TaxID=2020870 RepID=UPI00385DED7E
MKNITVLVLFLFAFNSYSQSELSMYEINNYKYIIIPEKFDFLKRADQYDVNSLTKFLFNKYGYNTYFDNEELPVDYIKNNCLGLVANVIKAKGGFLGQGLQINLTDCNNKIIISSKVGKSKEKEFTRAYNMALREAFTMFKYFKHEYSPSEEIKATLSSSNSESNGNQQQKIKQLEQEVAALKQNKEANRDEIIAVIETPSKEDKTEASKTTNATNVLYAQPIDKGFQVVDSSPKVVMILLETPKQNTFIVKDQNAIVYKEDGFWYLSTNDGTSTSLETLNIKF